MSAPVAVTLVQPADKDAPDHVRLARHLLRRLRRRLQKGAIDRAVEAEILIETVSQFDGVETRKLTAHPRMSDKTRLEVERLMRRFATSSWPAAGATLGGDERTELIDRFKRGRTLAATKGPNRAASHRSRSSEAVAGQNERLTAELRADVRRSADRPKAADVATMLLLARSVCESGEPLEHIFKNLRAPRPIVSIVASVAGFERGLLDLLRQGQILPGMVGLVSGYELRGGYTIRFDTLTQNRWQLIVFAGAKHDPEELERNEKLVDHAALSDHPILLVAESDDRLPERLKLAAHVKLTTGAIDADLVGRVILEVLACVPERLPAEALCARLTLPDLAIAIRPGVSPVHAVRILEQIANGKVDHVTTEETKPERRENLSVERRTPKAGRGNPGSGSEIIQPAALTGADSDRFIPRVETLSGYGDATRWALALKADLELWRASNLPWEEISARLLLSGPPGTGKTTFARALSNTLQVPLIATSVATWMEPGYLGDVLSRMKAAFAEAATLKPSILFIDELDGIGARRQRGEYAEYTNALINRALELFDGAARSTGVIVIAATNHPEMIDPALLRSGRLEKHIAIPPPDTDALVGILRHHLNRDLENVVATAPAPERSSTSISRSAASTARDVQT